MNKSIIQNAKVHCVGGNDHSLMNTMKQADQTTQFSIVTQLHEIHQSEYV